MRVVDARGKVLGSALFAPEPAPIALRVFARGVEVDLDEALLRERLRRAAARRGGLAACRVVHGEADLLPGLFVDRYGDAAVVQTAAAAMDRREGTIARLLVEVLGVRTVVARDDGSARDHDGLPRRKGVLLGDGPTRVTYQEGEVRFEADLLEDHKTGAFLDQRDNHVRAGDLARGEALDCFSYHGGFALQLARRAASVVAVEEAPAAAARITANARLNGLANVEVRNADAFAELRGFEAAGRKFDVVVVDPPALAKRKGPIEAALRAYKELNLRALRITARDGTLITCSCSGKITAGLFESMLADAARDSGREAVIEERRGAGADHPVLVGVPETEYLKCWILRVL
jgi:23S rRNA (cytosine1962-C5)-methyltransferase